MAVSPKWLHRVATYIAKPHQLKRARTQLLFRSLIDIAHDVRFSLARGAGTMPPKLFQRHKTFAAIVPLDGQFIADRLNVQRFHVLSSKS